MTTHIIVPTCAPQPRLRKMLASLAKHTPPCHLVLVVNHHEDWRHAGVVPQVLCLRDNGWQVRLIDDGEKIGYTPACNLGWRALEAEPNDYVAVLNDDVLFQGRWVEPLTAALEAGAKLVGPSLKTVGPDGLWGGPNDPPYIEGWCLMVRRWDQIREWVFDPQFAPQLCEDMDLGLRMAELGPRDCVVRQVEIPIQHIRHATVDPQTQPENARVWEENRRKLIAKWDLGQGARIGYPLDVKEFESAQAELAARPFPHPLSPPPDTAPPLATQAAERNWQIVP